MGSKKDPAWEHVDEVEVEGKKMLRCRYCDKVYRGGVARLKDHLAGIKGQIASCEEVPLDVKQEMREYVDKFQNKKKMSQLYREERIDKCTTLNSQTRGGSTSDSVTQRGIRGPMDRFVMSATDDVVDVERLGGNKEGGTLNEQRESVYREIGRFFYDNGLAFNVADSDSFVSMLRAVGRYGTGLKPPTSYELSTRVLEKEVEHTQSVVNDVKKTWIKTGVSILSDGWKDMRGRQLINFLVNNPYGTVFLRSVDASDVVKDANLLFNLLDEIVEEVGEEYVVQVVTDNAANYKKAGEMLMRKRQRLWWTPCAAHCIDLMLEKLGQLPQHRHVLHKAKKVTTFVYNHSWVLSTLRKYTNKDLVRIAPTRFATAYLTLHRINELREPLEQMFTSSDWRDSPYAKKPEGILVKKIIGRDPNFWSAISYVLRTTKPLVGVLRMADSEKMPGMGFLYGAMDKAKEAIAQNLGNELGAYQEIWKIIDEKWEFQMHRDLHAAAYFLNPRFQYAENKSTHPEIKIGLVKCLEKLIPDVRARERAYVQTINFVKQQGLFGFDMAKSTVNIHSPADWWISWGDETPELAAFAVKILSLTCSSSACERNWSSFNMIHTKKRNRLSTQKLNNLVYVMYNRKLQHRYQQHQRKDDDEDHLISDYLPSDDEWVVEDDAVRATPTNDAPSVDQSQPSGSGQQGRQKRSRLSRVNSVIDEPEGDDIPRGEDDDFLADLEEDVTPNWDSGFNPLDTDDTIYQD